MSLRSDAEADGNSQIIDFAVGTANRSSSNLVSTITASIPTGAAASGTLKGYLAFSTNSGDNLSERLRIDSSGRVLIGTTLSSYKFCVADNTNAPLVSQLVNTNTGSSTKSIFQIQTGTNRYVNFENDYTGAYIHVVGSGIGTYFSSFDNHIFRNNNGTERLRITSAGLVGVGQATPTYMLHVDSSNASDSTATAFFKGRIIRFDGAASAHSPRRKFSLDGTDKAQILLHRTNVGLDIATLAAEPIKFKINSAEKLRIDTNGKLLVGTSSATSLGSHTGASNVSTFNQSGITLTQYGVTTGFYYDRLNFTNSQYFIVNASNTGVYLGNGATSWTGYSDERMKTNITELDGTKAYNHIKTARATSFKWNATGYPTDTKIGFIAQDWETNYPEVVNSTTETIDSVENPKGIQYTETVPVLMAALKQSISKIEALEARVATLEGS